MAIPAVKRDAHFTYNDYKTWPDEERWELIDGTAYEMAGPSLSHQIVVGEIFYRIRSFLEGKPCRVIVAPFDVLLPTLKDQSDDEVDTVVQPDVLVFCDGQKLRNANARGAPDLAVEVLSPWNLRHDLDRKFRLYERAGVREYWIVDPLGHCVTVYSLDKEQYGDGDFLPGRQPLKSAVLEGFSPPVAVFFAGLHSLPLGISEEA